MPLMEVNRNKSDLTNGETEGEDMLLDTNNTQTVDKTNVENKKTPTTTEVGSQSLIRDGGIMMLFG